MKKTATNFIYAVVSNSGFFYSVSEPAYRHQRYKMSQPLVDGSVIKFTSDDAKEHTVEKFTVVGKLKDPLIDLDAMRNLLIHNGTKASDVLLAHVCEQPFKRRCLEIARLVDRFSDAQLLRLTSGLMRYRDELMYITRHA